MSGYDFPGASYDNWKTTPPDYYDDEPEEYEPEREYPCTTPRRHFLKDEAFRRSEVNHARNGAVELRRASEYLRGLLRHGRNAANLKRFARHGITEARRQRTLIGPPCPLEMIPF